jgi:hypothetical protein
MSKKTREICGCQSGTNQQGHEWVRFCAAHQAEHDDVRARWHADHRAEREQQALIDGIRAAAAIAIRGAA